MTLMFAYGSNLNLAQMDRRCPAAVPLGRLKLPDWQLVFRAVADIVPVAGAVCYGGVWRITDECEAALDIYEGVRSGLYRKEYIPIKRTPDGETRMLIYVMNSTGVMPPAASYLACIRQGYRDFEMKSPAWKSLANAVRSAWDDKAPSHIERQRYRRKGRPTLAKRPADPAQLPAA